MKWRQNSFSPFFHNFVGEIRSRGCAWCVRISLKVTRLTKWRPVCAKDPKVPKVSKQNLPRGRADLNISFT